jgi:hypothetical protein
MKLRLDEYWRINYSKEVLKKTSFLLPAGLVSILIGAGLGYVYFIYMINSGFLGVIMLIVAISAVGAGLYFLNRGLAAIEGFEKLGPAEGLIIGVDVDSTGKPLEPPKPDTSESA